MNNYVWVVINVDTDFIDKIFDTEEKAETYASSVNYEVGIEQFKVY